MSAGRKSSGSVDAGDDIVVVSCCRTAVCRAFKGQFKDTRPDDLLAAVLEDVIKRAPGVSPSDVEDIVVGTVLPKGDQGAIDARVAGLLAGFPEETSVRTLNRLCSSGLQVCLIVFSLHPRSPFLPLLSYFDFFSLSEYEGKSR